MSAVMSKCHKCNTSYDPRSVHACPKVTGKCEFYRCDEPLPFAGRDKGEKRCLIHCLAGLSCAGFELPLDGLDGLVGTNCISAAKVIWVPKLNADGTWDNGVSAKLYPLAVHFNFRIAIGQIRERQTSLKINLNLLHLTARPDKSQRLITSDGASILTAKDSVHLGMNSGWGREENFKSLVEVINKDSRWTGGGGRSLDMESLVDYFENKCGYDKAYMRQLSYDLKVEIGRVINRSTDHVIVVDFDEDASWAGREKGEEKK